MKRFDLFLPVNSFVWKCVYHLLDGFYSKWAARPFLSHAGVLHHGSNATQQRPFFYHFTLLSLMVDSAECGHVHIIVLSWAVWEPMLAIVRDSSLSCLFQSSASFFIVARKALHHLQWSLSSAVRAACPKKRNLFCFLIYKNTAFYSSILPYKKGPGFLEHFTRYPYPLSWMQFLWLISWRLVYLAFLCFFCRFLIWNCFQLILFWSRY